MTLRIDPNKVEEVTVECSKALTGKHFHVVEVTIGLAELAGRTIVGSSDHAQQAIDMLNIAFDHMKRTVIAGGTARGWNTGGESIHVD